MENLWIEYKNEIPLNMVRSWEDDLLKSSQWTFSGWSGHAREPYRHWSTYGTLSGTVKDIWECMNFSFKKDGFNLKPERILLNLFNFGDSSWIHTDNDREGHWTVIVYLNSFWDINWGGDTVLVQDNEIIKTFNPAPGKFVLFKSNCEHGARPVSREAAYPRLAIAYHCKNDIHI
jgi:hypothetical protein